MTASFPASTKVFTRQIDGVSLIDAADVNQAYDEIEAMQVTTPRYKAYVALINNAAGTITAYVLENTLGETLTWQGSPCLVISSGNLFKEHKTFTLCTPSGLNDEMFATASRNADNQISINVIDATFSPVLTFANLAIEIRVYP
jgi:hypothetical protein